MAFDLDPSYKQVPERIADFKAKHPEGSLQPADAAQPYRVETIGDRVFIVYTAAAYRSPDDPKPGIGIAWEPFPGKTPYTRDSELQNAETSAWGRAIVAALASESKAVASAEDVRNRRADQAPEATKVQLPDALADRLNALPQEAQERLAQWASRSGEPNIRLVPEPWVAAVERAVAAEESKLEPDNDLKKRADDIGRQARERREPSRKDAAAGDAA